MHKSSNTALQTNLFTNEFRGYEVERKWCLHTCDPVPTILQFLEDVHFNKWNPYFRKKSMGYSSTAIRFFGVEEFFFGYLNKDNVWKQIAMAAKHPSRDLYLLVFKQSDKTNSVVASLDPSIKIRKEEKKAGLVPYETILNQIQAVEPTAQCVGSCFREKCSFFITNQHSYRNFSVSADCCHSGSKVLSQVEIEYKGKGGTWYSFPDQNGIKNEYSTLDAILQMYYRQKIGYTTQTKFEWLINQNQ